MSLDNSTIQHPIPGDLQARVENALNLVTSLEAEHARLVKFIGSAKGEINDLHTEKKSIESQIDVSKETLKGLHTEIESDQDTLRSVQSELIGVNQELEKAMDQKSDALKKVDEANKQLGTWQEWQDAKEDDLNKRHVALSEREAIHETRVARLQEALK